MDRKLTEGELLLNSKEQLFYLAKYFLANQDAFDNKEFDGLPFWFHINSLPNMFVDAINKCNDDIVDETSYGLLNEPLKFYSQRVNPGKSPQKLTKFLMDDNRNSIIDYTQEIKLEENKDFLEHVSFTKIIGNGKTLTITLRSERLESFIRKRMFKDHPLFSQYFERFISLTKREKEILACIADGETHKEIGKNYLSLNTPLKLTDKILSKN